MTAFELILRLQRAARSWRKSLDTSADHNDFFREAVPELSSNETKDLALQAGVYFKEGEKASRYYKFDERLFGGKNG